MLNTFFQRGKKRDSTPLVTGFISSKEFTFDF